MNNAHVNVRVVEIHDVPPMPPRDIERAFENVVALLHHVTVLDTVRHQFENGGLTVVHLLAESHAALHTWPEHRYLWAELATCGDPSDLALFEKLLREQFFG